MNITKKKIEKLNVNRKCKLLFDKGLLFLNLIEASMIIVINIDFISKH